MPQSLWPTTLLTRPVLIMCPSPSTLLESLENKGTQDTQVTKESKESLDPVVTRVNMVYQVKWGSQEPQECVGRLGGVVVVVPRDSKGRWDLKDRMALGDRWAGVVDLEEPNLPLARLRVVM